MNSFVIKGKLSEILYILHKLNDEETIRQVFINNYTKNDILETMKYMKLRKENKNE